MSVPDRLKAGLFEAQAEALGIALDPADAAALMSLTAVLFAEAEGLFEERPQDAVPGSADPSTEARLDALVAYAERLGAALKVESVSPAADGVGEREAIDLRARCRCPFEGDMRAGVPLCHLMQSLIGHACAALFHEAGLTGEPDAEGGCRLRIHLGAQPPGLRGFARWDHANAREERA